MNLTDLLSQAGGISAMARELGVSEAQASSGAAALLPSILGGFKKKAAGDAGGLEGLGGLLGQLGGGSLLDNLVSQQPTDVSKGNDVLGQIFGTKEVSRAVAQKASASSGLDPSLLKKMLPMLAMAVTGVMARQAAPKAGGGGLGALVGGMLGGGGAKAGGLGALASMLDRDGDGNPLDDIMGMLGRK